MVLSSAITEKIKSVLKDNPQGLSITDIVSMVDLNRNTAGRYLDNLLISGQVEMRRFGMSKIYVLSQRVPVSAVLSISSELILQLDKHLRIVFANEPFLSFLSVSSTDLFGKNIEYSRVLPVFEEVFEKFFKLIKDGLAGTEWSGEITLTEQEVIFFCRIAPTVFDNGQKGVSVILEDITERKRMEDVLRESEERYRSLVEISPDAIIVHQDGTILYTNPSALALLNASHTSEIVGRKLFDFIHSGSRDAIAANIEKDIRGEKTPPLLTYMLRADGTTVTVEGRGVGILFDGKPAVQVAIRDITERKHAEDAMRESETRYRSLAEASQDLIFVIGKDDTVEYVNSFAAHLIGKQPKGIVGSKRGALFPPLVSDRQRRQLAQVFSTGTPSRSEGPIVIHNKTRWFDHFLVPVRNKDGSVQSVLGISRDITKQKQVENALRESEEKYRTLVEQANDGICIVQDNIIKLCNPAIAAFWGGSAEEILGRNFSDFIHPDAVGEVIKLHTMRMIGEIVPSTYETILQRKDGSRFFAEVNAGICPFEGKPANHVVIRDINDRKQAEEALKKSEERFRDLINTTADIVWQTDSEKRFVYVSPQVEKILGYTPNELVGRSPFEFLDPDSVELSQFVFDTAVRTHQNILLHESRWIDHDGNTVVMESHATPIYNSDGTCAGFRGIDRDITDR